MRDKGIDQRTLIRNSGLNYNHAYDVINGRNAKGVSRNKALGLRFGARRTPPRRSGCSGMRNAAGCMRATVATPSSSTAWNIT